MYPQERFAYHKRPFWHVLCLKRIGLPCCTFVTTIVTCSLQIILLSNYSATYNFSTCRHYLVENHLSFPSAPRWVRHTYLSKGLRLIPYTCGSSVRHTCWSPTKLIIQLRKTNLKTARQPQSLVLM